MKHYYFSGGAMVPHIAGQKGGCFGPGTQISTLNGTKSIELVMPGDYVECFDDTGKKFFSKVTETFYHENDIVNEYTLWGGEKLLVTPNHWVLNEDNKFSEIGTYEEEDVLIDSELSLVPILYIKKGITSPTYNFTVDKYHTYIANGIRVHNKGGGKGGGATAAPGVEDPNSLFSTDILFLTIGIGEGPIYRINPNGPQDMEINEGSIDDLINIDGDGAENNDVFKTLTRTGTITQPALPIFGEQTVTPQTFASSVNLKKGNISGVPRSAIDLQNTSASDWDELVFNFTVSALQTMDSQGNIFSNSVTLKVTVYDRTGSDIIAEVTRDVSGKTNTPYKFDVSVIIPEEKRSTSGYKFTLEKTSDDNDSSKVQDNVQATGWLEIEHNDSAYPRTAHIGVAIKAFAEHTGGVPSFSFLTKGLIVKVPSNYNQPVLASGEIDWRELELPETGTALVDGTSTNIGYTQTGYRLQDPGPDSVLTTANPILYSGIWDGTFKFAWTQNPVWIVYDLLTNKSYGLGIPEDNIDKFQFYKVAVYCDACDITTGAFTGVDGRADGTFRYKPNGLYTDVKEVLLGIPEGTQIKERRFILDVSIQDKSQVFDIINELTSTFRAILTTGSGKIVLNVDMPDEIPVGVFNETSIKRGSFVISGNKEQDIITGVNISYIEPSNHFKREVLRVDDTTALRDKNQIENVIDIQLPGVTRRSQAIRYAQYQIASSKYLRRKVTFVTGSEAAGLVPGEIISVSQRHIGVAYGYGGRVLSNATVGNANVVLEHFTSPALSNSVFTANTKPVGLRIIGNENDRVDLYVLSNTDFALSNTGNAASGIDYARVVVTQLFNPKTKSFGSYSGFTANNVPIKGDVWALGEVDINDHYRSTTDKLFKITDIGRDDAEGEITIQGVEYVPNVYTDSDTIINYTPVAYTDIISPLVAPPPPVLGLRPRAVRSQDGSVRIDVEVDAYTDKTGYPLNIETEFEYSLPGQAIRNITQGDVQNPLTLTANTLTNISNGTLGFITGKNGFKTEIGAITLICNAATKINSDTQIELTVEGLSDLVDDNFNKHPLTINDGGLGDIGSDFVTIPIKEKSNTGSFLGFVGYNPILTDFSSLITDNTQIASNKLIINNESSEGTEIYDVLDSAPFYIKISQYLDTRYFANNQVFLEGIHKTFINEGNISLNDGETSYDITLDKAPLKKEFITAFVDGIEINTTDFSWDGSTGVTINNLDSNDRKYRLESQTYGPPLIEIGDNIAFHSGNVYSVTDCSYDPAASSYNVAPTNNSVFKVYFGSQSLKSNVESVTGVNVTPDPIGIINNVDTSAGTFTLDYNHSTYPGLFRLANTQGYDLVPSVNFVPASFGKERVIRDVEAGTLIVKARNINSAGRRSPTVTEAVRTSSIPIQKVTNFTIEETLYIQQSVGVVIRLTITFDHITGQDVTDYEISYKLSGDSPDINTYNTVKVPAAGVESDGKIRYTVNNIERGRTTEINSITARVTPLNKEIRGITAEKTQTIVGKTSAPRNIINLTGGQDGTQAVLVWEYQRITNVEEGTIGALKDIDTKETVIRRYPGTLDSSQFEEYWSIADSYETVASSSSISRKTIDFFTTYTYLAKTRDTSGNLSDDIVGITLTTVKPANTQTYKAYSEDEPSGNLYASIPNDNAGENNWPSFNNSNNGGLSEVWTSAADNANGSSSGWTAVAGIPSDIQAEDEAYYYTKVRDIGSIVTGKVLLNLVANQATKQTWFDFHADLATRASDPNSTANVLIDTDSGGLGQYFTDLGVVYEANNATLADSNTAANVYAIWNDGQFANDVSNGNSFALIAGVINTNAIELGATFWANGEPTGDNVSFTNVTTTSGSSFKIVDLNQYSDLGSSTTFSGPAGLTSSQVFLRTATSNVFYANGNVNTSAWISSSVNDGFLAYASSDKTFRWFQLKYEVINNQPDTVDYLVDEFGYSVDLEDKSFASSITFDSAPTIVDFSSTGFVLTPTVSGIVTASDNQSASPAVIVFDKTTDNATINVYYSSNGELASTSGGVTVDITATGV